MPILVAKTHNAWDLSLAASMLPVWALYGFVDLADRYERENRYFGRSHQCKAELLDHIQIIPSARKLTLHAARNIIAGHGRRDLGRE